MAAELHDLVLSVTAEVLELDPVEVSDDGRFGEEVDADSLQKLEIVQTVEDRIGHRFTEAEVAELNSVATIVELANRYLAGDDRV